MNPDKTTFLNLRTHSERLTADEAAWLLGFSPHEIPILIAKNLLKPLGHPADNGPKHFLTATLKDLERDEKWHNKAADAVMERLFNRRLTRLTLGFSKKLEHLKNSVALSIAQYNLCRVHKSLQGETPAMAARLTDHVWSIAELLTESGQIGSERWICPLLERTVSPPIKNSPKRHNIAMNVQKFHE